MTHLHEDLPLCGGSESLTAESGSESVPNPASADPFAVNDLLASIEAGTYRPTPGSFGDLLIRQHDCTWHAGRSIGIFAKLAIRAQGIWWPMILNADPDSLSAEEVAYAAAAWRTWVSDGRRAFVTKSR